MGRNLLPSAAFFAAMAALGLVLPKYELLGFNQHLLLALNVLALNFCLGLGGQPSLAQGAFCGLGAYLSVLAHAAWPGGSLVIVPLVALTVFCVGFAVSYPLEVLGEGFMAMATLGLSLIFTNFAVSLSGLTGGPDGMYVSHHLAAGSLSLAGDRPTYYAFLLLLAAGMYVYVRVAGSRTGRALKACREDMAAASSCGVHRAATRSTAFGLGAGLSALAGALYAHYAGFILPAQFDLLFSLKALLFLVIGGPGHLLRPILAVLLLETVLGHVEFLGEAKVLFHGLLLGAALLVSGEGLGRARRLLPRNPLK